MRRSMMRNRAKRRPTSSPSRTSIALPLRGNPRSATYLQFVKREWMGIEPTRRLFSRHTGFEAQGGHQIRVHSPYFR